MKYTIEIIETVCYRKEIEADNDVEAQAKADALEEDYKVGDVVLGEGEQVEIYNQIWTNEVK